MSRSAASRGHDTVRVPYALLRNSLETLGLRQQVKRSDATLPDCSVAFEQSIAEGSLIGIGGKGTKAGAFRHGEVMSAVGQNRPLVVEIKGFKTSHFLKRKQLLWIGGIWD